VSAIQSILGGGTADLSAWAPATGQQIQAAATSLGSTPAGVQQGAFDLMQASHEAAQRWQAEGRSPFLAGGSVDPRFVDDVITQAPAPARAFTIGQARAGIPADQELHLVDAIALGATSPTPPTPTATPAPPTEPAPATTYDPALFERLRTWRREEADRQGKAAFHVFTDATLQRIAAARPQTEEELLAVKGVGAKKLEQFGPAVLDLTRAEPKEENPT